MISLIAELTGYWGDSVLHSGGGPGSSQVVREHVVRSRRVSEGGAGNVVFGMEGRRSYRNL